MTRAFPKDSTYIPGSARFTNNEKDTIEILITKQVQDRFDKVETNSIIMPADPNYPPYQWVLENCEDLDGIHTNTFRWIREQRLAYEQQVMDIAKREGLLFTSGLADVRSYKSFLTELFKPFDETREAELNNLFSIKLELFEMPNIRQNQNAELKKVLRRAETPLDVIRAAIDIHLDNLENGLEIEEEDTSDTSQESA